MDAHQKMPAGPDFPRVVDTLTPGLPMAGWKHGSQERRTLGPERAGPIHKASFPSDLQNISLEAAAS